MVANRSQTQKINKLLNKLSGYEQYIKALEKENRDLKLALEGFTNRRVSDEKGLSNKLSTSNAPRK